MTDLGGISGSSSLRSPEPLRVSAHTGDDPGRETAALQAFEDAYNDAWGWPRSQIDPTHPIQQATLGAIKAACAVLNGDTI